LTQRGGISAALALVNLLGSMATSNSELMSVTITSEYDSLGTALLKEKLTDGARVIIEKAKKI